MTKPNWNRRLGEVLQQDTRKMTLMGNKGKEYQTEVVPVLEVVFGTVLEFYNVTGGQLNNSFLGWYKAENVKILK